MQGKPNQYFNDCPQLEGHFDKEHFRCKDAHCLVARFVVFRSEIELRKHEQSVYVFDIAQHEEKFHDDEKITVHFMVMNEDGDGTPFEMERNVTSLNSIFREYSEKENTPLDIWQAISTGH